MPAALAQRTKIVCTIGPASRARPQLDSLLAASDVRRERGEWVFQNTPYGGWGGPYGGWGGGPYGYGGQPSTIVVNPSGSNQAPAPRLPE